MQIDSENRNLTQHSSCTSVLQQLGEKKLRFFFAL